MKISKEQVQHVAKLARLNLTEEETNHMLKDMEAIINFADQLNEADMSAVSPTAFIIPNQNVFREDEVVPSMDRDLILANAPRSERGCFSVPKIVE